MNDGWMCGDFWSVFDNFRRDIQITPMRSNSDSSCAWIPSLCSIFNILVLTKHKEAGEAEIDTVCSNAL